LSTEFGIVRIRPPIPRNLGRNLLALAARDPL